MWPLWLSWVNACVHKVLSWEIMAKIASESFMGELGGWCVYAGFQVLSLGPHLAPHMTSWVSVTLGMAVGRDHGLSPWQRLSPAQLQEQILL